MDDTFTKALQRYLPDAAYDKCQACILTWQALESQLGYIERMKTATELFKIDNYIKRKTLESPGSR